MSGIGNLLTTGSSTPWTPFQRNVNVFLNSNITGSSQHNNSYKASNVIGYTVNNNEYSKLAGMPDKKISWQANTNKSWLADLDGGDTHPHIQFDLNPGVGTAALDSFIIGSANSTLYQAGGYSISGSNDDTNWTALTESVTFPGGSGLSSNGYDDTLTFTNNTEYRYYQVAINNYSGDYAGFNYIVGWDSSLFANQLNLFNPTQVNVTASFEDASSTSLVSLTSKIRDNHGWYINEEIGSMDIHWDEPKLFRGWFGIMHSSTGFVPGGAQFWKSETGALDDWTLISTIDITSTLGPFSSYQGYFIDIGTPVKTQYLRTVFFAVGSSVPAQNFLHRAAWMYEMSSSQAPPVPASVSATAFGDSVGLTWTQNSGSDNRLADIVYNIERSSDSGQNYTPIFSASGSIPQTAVTSSFGTAIPTQYIDTGLPAGNYMYRIQSKNQHHLTTSSFIETAEVSSPPPSVESKKIYVTNKGNIMINPNDTTLIEL